MKHFTYKTTNNINGKYYYGVHSTDNLDDGYLGSGKLLRRAIKNYGKENFTIEILEFFDTREEALAREAELVTRKEVDDPMCYNIKGGGEGGSKIYTDEELRQHTHEYMKDYYSANKDTCLERGRKWNKSNKERRQKYMREYSQNRYANNKDYYSEHNKLYYSANKEILKRNSREYYEANKERNKEKKREYMKEYDRVNKEKKREYQRLRYQRKKAERLALEGSA